MTVSSGIRRATAIAVTALALVCGGLTAATPARAQATAQAVVSNPDLAFIGDPIWDLNTTPGVTAVALPTSCSPGCLWITEGSSLTITHRNGLTQKLTAQGDGNVVLYVSNGKKWAPRPDVRPNGYQIVFQNDANLVVRNSAGAALWASNTHTYPDAILAFQDDGNLVIYPSVTNFHALWASGTKS